jgi:hypothetical protein
MKKIRGFIDVIYSDYPPNPYHNFQHAVDVTHAVFQYMNLMQARMIFSMPEQFSLLISALAHDAGHPGVNNGFLIEVQDEIAVRYNDRSPLENMHCCKLFQTTSQAGADIFVGIPQEQYRDLRKLIIEVILHTDIVQHPGMVNELKLLYEMNAKTFEAKEGDAFTEQELELLSSSEHKKLLANLLLHGSDISNPVMPWEVAHLWAKNAVDEFFAQGDQEKKLGIPVQMLNDRDKVSRPHSQIGFIEFIVAPMVVAELKIIPSWHEVGHNLQENLTQWEAMWLQEANRGPEEQEKVHDRVQKLIAMLNSRQKSKKASPTSPTSRKCSKEKR